MAHWEERVLAAIEKIWISLHGKKWNIDWTNAGPLKMHVWNVTKVRPKLFGLLFNFVIFNFFNVSHHIFPNIFSRNATVRFSDTRSGASICFDERCIL